MAMMPSVDVDRPAMTSSSVDLPAARRRGSCKDWRLLQLEIDGPEGVERRLPRPGKDPRHPP